MEVCEAASECGLLHLDPIVWGKLDKVDDGGGDRMVNAVEYILVLYNHESKTTVFGMTRPANLSFNKCVRSNLVLIDKTVRCFFSCNISLRFPWLFVCSLIWPYERTWLLFVLFRLFLAPQRTHAGRFR